MSLECKDTKERIIDDRWLLFWKWEILSCTTTTTTNNNNNNNCYVFICEKKRVRKLRGLWLRVWGFATWSGKPVARESEGGESKDLRSCCRSCCSKVSKRERGVGRRRRRRRRRRRIRIGNPRQIDVIRAFHKSGLEFTDAHLQKKSLVFFFWVCVWRSADLQLAAKNPQHSLLQKRIL
jgi:hypothetical protein